MKIGLSLSLCIKDIMAGTVVESDVAKIITATAARTEADWEKLYDTYRRAYWRSATYESAAAIELVKRLRAQGKIEQPRLANPDYGHYIGRGVWLTIHTNYDHPPIPDRSQDWSAVDDNYDGAPDTQPPCPIGRGPTEVAAIIDLISQIRS